MKILQRLPRLAPPLVALGLASFFSAGCRQIDQASVDALSREIADLGSAAEVGFSPADLDRLDAAFRAGDPAHEDELFKIARKGVRTPQAIQHIRTVVPEMQARAERNAQ